MLLSYEPFLPTTDASTLGHEQPRTTAPAAEIDSLRLLQGQREVRIRHGNEYYRLRHTRNDKLILTK
jgi:hemin uptake protein HemP